MICAKTIERIGLVIVTIQLVLTLIHFSVREYFTFYREVAALLLMCCVFLLMFTRRIKNLKTLEVLLLISGVFYIVFTCLIHPGRRALYSSDPTLASESIAHVGARAYVVRNALLYMPIAFFFGMGNFSLKALQRMAWIIAVAAPIAVVLFFVHYAVLDSPSLLAYMALRGQGLYYNSYVPALTFPFILALYLALYDRGRLSRYVAYLSCIFLLIYIAFSGSRQSLLFCLIAILLMVGAASQYRLIAEVALLLLATGVVLLLTVPELTYDTIISTITRDRGLLDTPRLKFMITGIRLLSPDEWLTGAGVTSVLYSGPHADYIRWLQRIGFFGAILLFLPFFILTYRVTLLYVNTRRIARWHQKLNLAWAFSTPLFGIYHSFFGYPREDAYQAPFFWLGFGLCLTISRIHAGEIIAENKKLGQEESGD